MEVLYWLEGLRTPVLDQFFSLVTHLGSETVFLAVAIIVFWCVSKSGGYYLLTVGFFGTAINQFLKLVCRVPRPWVRDPNFTIVESAREAAGGYSFPSGHTQNAMSVLGCPARFTKKTWLRAVCVVLILLVGLSRMYLGVHTPADVGVSLVIGCVLVFGVYPVFRKSGDNPALMTGILAVLVAVAVAFVLFVELNVWSADVDGHNLASGTKNAYLLLGCAVGVLLSSVVERKYVHFDTRGAWWVQVVKTAVGLALVLGLKAGLKPVLNLVFNGHQVATAVRYFLLVVFAVCVWPLTFRWFAGLKKK